MNTVSCPSAAGASYVKAPTTDQCDWRIKGLCSTGKYTPVLWDSRLDDESVPEKHRREIAAKALCHQCPVEKECAKWALSREERHGTWGGLTEVERDALLGRPPRHQARRHAS